MTNSCVSFKPHYAGSMGYASFEPFQTVVEGLNTPASTTKTTVSSSTKKIKEGFVGLESAPFGGDGPIDRFSGTPGKLECDSISSGLTNSRGGLCLDDNQQKLLRTRGGNATGGDFQIG